MLFKDWWIRGGEVFKTDWRITEDAVVWLAEQEDSVPLGSSGSGINWKKLPFFKDS